MIGLSFLYIVLRNTAVKNYYWFLLAIVISGIIQAVYGNLQLLGYYASNHSGFKMTGSFFNPGPYAGFLASVWPIALGMYLFKEKISVQVQEQVNSNSEFLKTVLKYTFEYIPLLGIISMALVLPASQSRAAWLAVLCSSVILVELRYRTLKTIGGELSSGKKIIGSLLAICIVMAGLFAVYQFKKGSSDGRLFIWKVATEMIKGLGANAGPFPVSFYYPFRSSGGVTLLQPDPRQKQLPPR